MGRFKAGIEEAAKMLEGLDHDAQVRVLEQIAATDPELAKKLEDIKKADSFEACFQINENVFNGYRSIQLMLKDIRTTNDV